MTLAEIRARIEATLFDRWLRDAGITPAMWATLGEGIPAAWAKAIAADRLGVSVSDWPRVVHGPGVLHKRSQPSTKIVSPMNADQRLNISRGQNPKDLWLRAVRKARLTQNDLARELGIPASLLSMYRKGVRPIPVERARKVAGLIDWPATAKNWPGGILGE